MGRADDILDNIQSRKIAGESFMLATVVRTVAATAAKAGAPQPPLRHEREVDRGTIRGVSGNY
jgi:hypothetical protein